MGTSIDKNMAYKRLELLVKRFKNDLKQGNISGSHPKTKDIATPSEEGKKYSESQIRQGYILPMFRDVLGWDIDNSINEVIPELHNNKGFADFVFVKNNKKKFVLETKKPYVNIDPSTSSGRASIRQAIGYSRSIKNVDLALVSNFELLTFSHCFVMPKKDEELKNVLESIHFTELLSEKKFSIIWQFRFEACSDDDFCKDLFKKIDSKLIRVSKTVDENLISDLKKIRVDLANSFKPSNTETEIIDILALDIINKITFIRSLEDRGIIDTQLASIIDKKNIWNKFKLHLKNLYQSIPIEILDISKNDLLNSNGFEIGDKPFSSILSMFYDRGEKYYHDCYDFKYIPSELLGYVYENSIAFRLVLKGKKFKLEKKKIYKDGVHYTPAYIAKTLSKKAIQRTKNIGKDSNKENLICADIACGSGTFLTAIYDCLYADKFNHLSSNSSNLDIYDGREVLPLKERRKILEKSIFGIDIDPSAVDVSKLCLYLKYFECYPSNSPRKIEFKNIPNIEENVIFADSLIDTTMKIKFPKGCIPVGKQHKKIFELIKNKKFDVIVGNPPYIKIQDLLKIESFPTDVYKEKYNDTIGSGQIEFATAFVERSCKILSSYGNSGFILPNKIFKNKQGQGLRNFICKKDTPSVSEFVDFNSVQIFDASIYTCLLHLTNSKDVKDVKSIQIYRMADGAYLLKEIDKYDAKYPSNDFEIGSVKVTGLSENPWNLIVGIKRLILEKISLKYDPLESIVESGKIFQGIPTGSDKIFILEKIKELDDSLWEITSESLDIIKKFENENSDKNIEDTPTTKIEKEYLRPIYQGSTDLKLFFKNDTKFYLLFPYDSNGKLLTDDKFLNSKAYNYLNNSYHKQGIEDSKGKELLKGLEKRENGKYAGSQFYQFSRPQNIELWAKEKIMFPYMVDHFNAHLSSENLFVNVSTGGYGIVSPSEELKKYSLLAIMNSEVFNFYVKSFSGDFRGGWFECSKQYVKNVPIPVNEFSANELEELKSNLGSLYETGSRLYNKTLTSQQKIKTLTEFNAELDWLNSYVAEKYNLTEDEMTVIDFYSGSESDLEYAERMDQISDLVNSLEKRLAEEILSLAS